MKKIMFILSIIVSLIIITSCGGGGNSRIDTKLQTGTEGVNVEFSQNLQREVLEEGRMYATFEITNGGYSDIGAQKEGIIVLGIEQDLMKIDSWEKPNNFRVLQENVLTFDLRGKSISNTRGEKQVISAILETKRIDETLNKMETVLTLNICYPYSTVFSDTICIDTDPNNMKIAEKTCTTKDISPSGGQGAPIAIRKIEQKIIPGSNSDNVRVQMKIFAENKDNGIIISPEKINQMCIGKGFTAEDYDEIALKSLKFSDFEYGYDINTKNEQNLEIECSPNPMRASKQGYYTTCLLKEEYSIPKNKLTFETPLVIELDYGYKVTNSEKIFILNKEQSYE